jgi:hypothetical protein
MADTYCDNSDVKSFIGLSGSSQDSNIDLAIKGACRLIDNYCGRHFYKPTSAFAKHFTPDNPYILDVPDIANTTSLVVKIDDNDDGTYEKTLTLNTDFYLNPINVQDMIGDQEAPFNQIRIFDRRSSERFDPDIKKHVEITALWGFESVPDAVKMATILQTSRLWKRKDAPFSTYGNSDVGEVELMSRMDPDAKQLIKGYIKHRL